MLGGFTVTIKGRKETYSLNVKKKITVIQGDSGSGKTRIISLLNQIKRDNTIGMIDSKYEVDTLPDWHILQKIMQVGSKLAALKEVLLEYDYKDKLLIVDEDYDGLYTHDFARFVNNVDCFFIIIARKPLHNLTYDMNEIYRLSKTRAVITLQQVYEENMSIDSDYDTVIVEDSNSGFDFYSRVFRNVISAKGKSNVANKMLESKTEHNLIIIDSAAFGNEIEHVLHNAASMNVEFDFFTPISFEWLICASGIVKSEKITRAVNDPYSVITGASISWEQYFTDLLVDETADLNNAYGKSKLNECYYLPCCKKGLNKFNCNIVQGIDKKKAILGNYFYSQQDMNLF